MTGKAISDPIPDSFEEFFENSLTGFLTLTSDGDVIRANTRFAAWMGLTPEDLVGRHVTDFLVIAGRIYYDTHLGPLLRMQGFFDEIALELACENGSRLPVIVNALEQRNEDGEALFIRMTVFKATERRRYERDLLSARNELRELNQTLEARVADEVLQRLSLEGRLSEEHRNAELREQFIAVLSHDLRNPLASIDAGMNLLSRTPLDEKATSVVELVRRSVSRMADLIEDVMDFARGRLGSGITLDRQDTLLEPVLRQVVDELIYGWPGRTIHSEFALASPINCDASRIAQLLSNLIANALSHGADDGPVSVGGFVDQNIFELYVVNLGSGLID